MQTVLEWFYRLISVLPASFLFDLPWKQTWELAKKSKIFQNQQSQVLQVPGDVKLTTGPVQKAENNAQKCQVKVKFPHEMGRGRAVAAWAPIFPFFWAVFSVRRWARCFFSQLFLSTSFVNEQEGGGFMWMKSSWVELGFSWQLFQDLACVITSEKKTIFSRRILRLMSALAPVSWAVEVFLSFFGLFWVFVCMLFLLWTQPHCPCCCHGRGSHQHERSSKLGCQGCFLYSAQEWKIHFF